MSKNKEKNKEEKKNIQEKALKEAKKGSKKDKVVSSLSKLDDNRKAIYAFIGVDAFKSATSFLCFELEAFPPIKL